MNLFNAARKICESFVYDPGHSDLDNEQPIAIHCTLGDWRRLNSALMLAGQRAEPEAERSHLEEIGRLAHDYIRNRKAMERNKFEDGGMEEYRAILAMENALWAKLVDMVMNGSQPQVER